MPPEILWSPTAASRARSRMGRYVAWLAEQRGLRFDDYDALWRWSTADLEAFWSSIAAWFDVLWHDPPSRILARSAMPGAVWCPGATLNYAAHALRGAASIAGAAVVGHGETRDPVALSGAELIALVGRARAGLRRLGVGRGDRVAAILPHIPETLVAFLAAASLGATFVSCAPELGARAIVDRLAQVRPRVLLAVDGYRHGGRDFDRRGEIATVVAALPDLGATVLLPYLDPAATAPGTVPWGELVAEPAAVDFEAVPFDHPLYILFSSGTTGLPKPIVHGHGGIVLEHHKLLGLHLDLGPGDRFFWFSTTGWAMWNIHVSGLLVGASLVAFDGHPMWPDASALWRLAADTRVTVFGTSAPHLMACARAGLVPGRDLDLSALRGVGSTGAPLPAEGFRWVYEAVGRELLLSSISGGTDVCTAFLGGAPLVPVTAGELACPLLGVAAQAVDGDGHPVVGREGELVITAPMPSMPVGFWGDSDGARYRAAYFEKIPGVWCHGDWITFSERGTSVISGRSDATLNRGGVRLGTAELYAVVEAHPEVADSLAVHLEDAGGGAGELILFVVPARGADVDDALRQKLATSLRTQLSPRHVPDRIEALPAIPRTLSGKKLEVPVKRILAGTPVERALGGAAPDPLAIAAVVAYAERRRRTLV